jgi:hypothetical protein
MLFIGTHADVKINEMKCISETALFQNLDVYSRIGTHILPIVCFISCRIRKNNWVLKVVLSTIFMIWSLKEYKEIWLVLIVLILGFVDIPQWIVFKLGFVDIPQ